MAQDSRPDTQLFTAPSETPKPFDWSRFKLLVPPPKPAMPLVILNTPKPLTVVGNKLDKPCAVARITLPGPSIDPRIAPGSPRSSLPMEANSKDITEMDVPAPSCLDIGRTPAPR